MSAKTKSGPGRPVVDTKVRLVLSSSKEANDFLRWFAERNNVDLSAGFNTIMGTITRGESLSAVIRDYNSRSQF